MKLSLPKKYIETLLDDLTKKIMDALSEYYHQVYSNTPSIRDAYFILQKELDRIEEIKKEILEICLENHQ